MLYPISHYQKYHDTLCLSLQNFALSIIFIFSWDLQSPAVNIVSICICIVMHYLHLNEKVK